MIPNARQPTTKLQGSSKTQIPNPKPKAIHKVTADVRRRILSEETLPPPHVGGYTAPEILRRPDSKPTRSLDHAWLLAFLWSLALGAWSF